MKYTLIKKYETSSQHDPIYWIGALMPPQSNGATIPQHHNGENCETAQRGQTIPRKPRDSQPRPPGLPILPGQPRASTRAVHPLNVLYIPRPHATQRGFQREGSPCGSTTPART